jgi:hypothetical protein
MACNYQPLVVVVVEAVVVVVDVEPVVVVVGKVVVVVVVVVVVGVTVSVTMWSTVDAEGTLGVTPAGSKASASRSSLVNLTAAGLVVIVGVFWAKVDQ